MNEARGRAVGSHQQGKASGLCGAEAYLFPSLGLQGDPARFLPRFLETAECTATGDPLPPRGLGWGAPPGSLSEPRCPCLGNRKNNSHLSHGVLRPQGESALTILMGCTGMRTLRCHFLFSPLLSDHDQGSGGKVSALTCRLPAGLHHQVRPSFQKAE